MVRKWHLSGIMPGDFERTYIGCWPDARWQFALKKQAELQRMGWKKIRLRMEEYDGEEEEETEEVASE